MTHENIEDLDSAVYRTYRDIHVDTEAAFKRAPQKPVKMGLMGSFVVPHITLNTIFFVKKKVHFIFHCIFYLILHYIKKMA